MQCNSFCLLRKEEANNIVFYENFIIKSPLSQECNVRYSFHLNNIVDGMI